ncbi:hypothetical protein [Mesorhizobium ciceri]|uniref:hypothetical protein n=1 Tax=Mesorhizobium TaxID=68287 RepID=UPI00047E3A47|nr:hypothetical protein [Mesorhizobium ciceri]
MRDGISFTVSASDRQRLLVAAPGSPRRCLVALLTGDGLRTSAIMTDKAKGPRLALAGRFMHEGINGLRRDRS